MRSTAIVLVAIAWGIPPGLTAQAQMEVAPYLGSYRPTSIIGIGDGSFPNPNTPPHGVRDTVKQLNGAAWGIRVTMWGPGRLAFEATVGYAPSSLWSSLAYTAPVYDAHVLTMSLKALLRVTPPPSARGAARGWWGGSRRSWRRRVELRSIVSRSEDVRRCVHGPRCAKYTKSSASNRSLSQPTGLTAAPAFAIPRIAFAAGD